MTRFAGFRSPGSLVGDPHLTRQEKIDALGSWRALVLRAEGFEDTDTARCRRLVREIAQGLDRLRKS